MGIKTTLEKYKILGDYFARDSERENEVLNEFKESNPNLTKQQTVELLDLLNNRTILEKANRTKNLIELYYYKLRYSDKIKDSDKIPNNADELIKAIAGQKEYEDLLYEKLGWARTTPANSSLPKAGRSWWQKLFSN